MQNGYSHESSIPDTSESVSTSSDDLTGPSSIKSEHPLAQNQIDGQQSIKEDRPATPHSPSMRETTGSPTSASNSTAPFVMRDSSWLELETCREFLRGDCIRDDCRYAHPAANVVIKDGKVVCCFDYLKVCSYVIDRQSFMLYIECIPGSKTIHCVLGPLHKRKMQIPAPFSKHQGETGTSWKTIRACNGFNHTTPKATNVSHPTSKTTAHSLTSQDFLLSRCHLGELYQ